MFVLKRLSDAISGNDNILGVIDGVEVNQSNLGHSITRPHGPAQVALLNSLLLNAGVDPSWVSVVEAHATGTQAGDPIEVESIRKVLAAHRPNAMPVYITSIKGNIGHAEAAAGAAGLAKLLLMIRYESIPPQISLKDLNPRIKPLSVDNTAITTKAVRWPRSRRGLPRVAVLNSFGATGSNAALVLEEWMPPAREAHPERMSFVFGLSAQTFEALEELRAKYIAWLRDSSHEDLRIGDLAYTMTARRQIYAHRMAVHACDKKELVERLATAKVSQCAEGRSSKVVFVFCGQSAQYLGMGASLYHSSLVFKQHIDECHAFLTSNGFVGVLPIINPSPHGTSLDHLEELQAHQAAIFALEYALAKLWMSWGVQPSAVIGHR